MRELDGFLPVVTMESPNKPRRHKANRHKRRTTRQKRPLLNRNDEPRASAGGHKPPNGAIAATPNENEP